MDINYLLEASPSGGYFRNLEVCMHVLIWKEVPKLEARESLNQSFF